MKNSKWENMKKTLSLAWRLDKKAVLLIVETSILKAVTPYIPIYLSAYVLNNLVQKAPFMTIMKTVLPVLLLIFAVQIIGDYLNVLRDRHVSICVSKFYMKKADKTLGMDYAQLDSSLTNEIRSRIQSDNSWGAGFSSVLWQLPWLLGSLLGIVAAVAVLIPLISSGAFFNSLLTPVFLAFLLVISLASTVFNTKYTKKKTFALMDKSAESWSSYGYFLWGTFEYKAGKDIRLFNSRELISDYIGRGEGMRKSWTRKYAFVNSLGGGVSGLGSGLLQGGAYLFVVLRAAAGAIGIGGVIKYAAAISNLAGSISSVLNAVAEFSVTVKRQQSTLEYFDIPSKMHRGTLPVEKRSDNEYEIEFKDVSFKYPGSDTYALKNISLKLRIGERLAVVGMNGSGKTTFIKLLCRLYDPTEGEITLNGIDIKKYDYDEYMGIFSVVFQDFRLFSFSLGQNVAARVEYDRERVETCLKEVGLGERFKAMDKGTETCLYKDFEEDGVEISGGEAQKIALARALYKNAPFIVLDEPTAALDPVAEYEIYTKFDGIVGDKTAIYISHRLSSCRFCDDIAVFHEGRVIQRGGHEELLGQASGKYRELWHAQAQYYCTSAQE